MNWKSRLFAAVLLALLPVFIVAQESQPKAQAPVPVDAKQHKEKDRPVSCVCAKYRYAQFPNFSSYYSKRCIGTQIDYVSYDTPDIGPTPNLDCSEQDCTACPAAFDRKGFIPSLEHEAHEVICKAGLKNKVEHDFSPTLEGGACIVKPFIAKIMLSKDRKTFLHAKVFQIIPPVTVGDKLRVFGAGVETQEGGSTIEIDWDDVTPVPTSSGDQTHCIRFQVDVVGHEDLVLKKTEFQVITHTPVPLKKGH